MYTLITTRAAKFTIDNLSLSHMRKQMWLEGYAVCNPKHLVQVWDNSLQLTWERGPKDFYPCIWTHTPVPYEFDVVSLNQQFESRAASVLSDYEEPTNFASDPSYPDGRYLDTTVRAAWMMYVDQAVQNFLEKH